MHKALAKLSSHFHIWAIFKGLQDYIRFEPSFKLEALGLMQTIVTVSELESN